MTRLDPTCPACVRAALPDPVERACERVEAGQYVDPADVALIVSRLRVLERRVAAGQEDCA